MLQINCDIVNSGQLHVDFKFLKKDFSSKELATLLFLLKEEDLGGVLMDKINEQLDETALAKLESSLMDIYQNKNDYLLAQRWQMAQEPAILYRKKK